MSDREEQKEKDTESLRVEIAQLRSDLSAMGRTIKDRASDVGSTAYERVKESSGKAKDQAQRAAASVTHQIEERPLISVLVSFVIGSPAAGMFRGNRVSPPAGTGCAQTPAWPRESLRRHHPAGAHQEGHRREPFHRRGLPQDLGPFALFRRPQRARTGAPADAGEPPFGAHRIRKRPDRAHDGTITTEAVDVLWGTDMTQSVTLAEGVAHVFVAVDHCTVNASASTPTRVPTASRPWSQSARVCAGTSAPSARTWPPASCSGTTTDRTICPTTSRARSPSSASRPRHPSCASPRATASPSASSVHSKKTSCRCATSRPSKRYAWRCWISPPGTIPTGWSPVMATEHPLRSGPTSRASSTWPHERCSRLSHNRGAVHGRSPVAIGFRRGQRSTRGGCLPLRA